MNKTLTAISVWFASLKFTRDISVAYIGVPLNVLVACFIGAYCSFCVAEKVEPRRRMWSLWIACVFMGAAFTALANGAINYFTDMEMTDALQAGLGAVVSFITRFFLPWLADVVKHGKWLTWIPWIRQRSDNS